ncbi:MAG TPA: acyl-CoA dehydrogenase family protein [Acidimicrobiales bacterium]|nr:acyl-CoA dehydrogenase family protein [Acidimicrobiales bacterium]
MDFDLTDEQQATIDVAAKLLGDKATPDAVRAVEHGDDLRFDRALWSAMADAGLLGIAVPAEHGGAGLGVLELCLVLEEVGRRAAPVPALAALAFGGLPVARWGTPDQQAALLPGLAAGTTVLTAALVEPHGDPTRPTVSARPRDGGWVLDGSRTNVPAGLVADTIVVPAATPAGEVGLFLVPATAPGLDRRRQDTTTGTPEALVALDGVAVAADAVLGPLDGAGTALAWLVEHATVALCAVAAGVCAEAVRLTGEYTTAREQFGRPIATFQAVGQRAADAYVDAQAVRLTMLQAAWRLSAGMPAAREVAVAKYWAAAGGQRVVHAASHLHGGVGVDRDYPLHRYFLLAKQLELSLGGTRRQLVRLGGMLAADGAGR